MNKEEEIPLGNIHKQCQISSSQESYHQNSPSVLDSDSDQVLFPKEVKEENDSDNTQQLESIITVSPSPSPSESPPEGSTVDSWQEKEPTEEGGDGYDYEYVDSDKLGFSSVDSQKVNVKGGQEEDNQAKRNEKLKALLDVLQMDDGKNDLFETAKKLGMTFPRPRWWPPEGGEEEF